MNHQEGEDPLQPAVDRGGSSPRSARRRPAGRTAPRGGRSAAPTAGRRDAPTAPLTANPGRSRAPGRRDRTPRSRPEAPPGARSAPPAGPRLSRKPAPVGSAPPDGAEMFASSTGTQVPLETLERLQGDWKAGKRPLSGRLAGLSNQRRDQVQQKQRCDGRSPMICVGCCCRGASSR